MAVVRVHNSYSIIIKLKNALVTTQSLIVFTLFFDVFILEVKGKYKQTLYRRVLESDATEYMAFKFFFHFPIGLVIGYCK